MIRKKLVLQNGQEFIGNLFGYDQEVIAELCFNTSMVGYQEIMSDPSYASQMLVMTYPLIGSYGVNDYDYESKKPFISAFIVNKYIDFPSNFRCQRTFDQELKKHKIVGLSGIDTRMLTTIVRQQGSQPAIITSVNTSQKKALAKLQKWVFPFDIVKQITHHKAKIYPCANFKYLVVVINHGVKTSIIDNLVQRNCQVVLLPYGSKVEEILAYQPDGMVLTNGPGDPRDCPKTITLVQRLKGHVPIFGICLGHQIIGLAYGAKIFKMNFGHRGSNHPVKNLLTNKIEITTQNHSYGVMNESVKHPDLKITHVNLHDGNCEGLKDQKNHLFSVQYHPESSAGPEDSKYLFDQFIEEMSSFKLKQKSKVKK